MYGGERLRGGVERRGSALFPKYAQSVNPSLTFFSFTHILSLPRVHALCHSLTHSLSHVRYFALSFPSFIFQPGRESAFSLSLSLFCSIMPLSLYLPFALLRESACAVFSFFFSVIFPLPRLARSVPRDVKKMSYTEIRPGRKRERERAGLALNYI